MLADLELLRSYRSGRDSLLDDFYVPCLTEAVVYDRAVGFFSSTLLHMTALAYSDFVARSGHMRLVCSPALAPADFAAMKDVGVAAQRLVRDDLEALLARPASVPATRLLATLVSHGYMEVQIAFAENPQGIFHDKLGVFKDEAGRCVSFVGSANETYAAWGLNHESFEVFTSWQGESDLLRTRDHAATFERLWAGREAGVSVELLDSVTHDRLLEVSHNSLETALEAVRWLGGGAARVEGPKELLPHQTAVLDDWENHSRRGIVNFATGAGKTIVAIEAARRWTRDGGSVVVMVPGRELHEQWRREIQQEFPAAQVLLAGAGAPVDVWQRLVPYFTSVRAGAPARIVLVTNKTFARPAFQHLLRQGSHLLLVADEMHRLGSPQVLRAVEGCEWGGTLGLSATYERKYDTAGTVRLVEVFGSVLEPAIGIAEAIHMGRLVPYDYRLHTIALTEDEQAEYDELTDRIRKSMARSNGDISDYVKMLLLKRARILKQASVKVGEALAILREHYEAGDRWLVYCDSIGQLKALVGACEAEGLPVLEYYAGMRGDRPAVLRSLADFGGIVVAIRCLDEGVDIPVTDHALIVASSTVEREYVQRRGRVLRAAPNKDHAVIHDLLLADDEGGALTLGEAARALEFARLARNRSAKERLKLAMALSRDVRIADVLGDWSADDEEGDDD